MWCDTFCKLLWVRTFLHVLAASRGHVTSSVVDAFGRGRFWWLHRCRCYGKSNIDYRRADGRFLMSPRGMAVSNTRYPSSSETRVNAGIRGWKLHLSESTWCQKFVGGICFTNKWLASFSTAPDIFKPLLKRSIFKCISWLNGSFFGSEHRGFMKEEAKTY